MNDKEQQTTEELFRTSTDEAGAVDLVLDRLAAWAKWLNLLRLENPLRGLAVDFDIKAAGPNRDPDLVRKPDLTLKAGEDVEFVVTNRSGKPVYFAILDIASDGSVTVVYPGEGRTEELVPGEPHKESAQTSLPEGRTSSRDYLKLVVTQSPVDFRFLRQQGIKDVPTDVDDPLAILLGEAALIERNLRSRPEKLEGWATTLKILEVVE
jgi:hypothetical protein